MTDLELIKAIDGALEDPKTLQNIPLAFLLQMLKERLEKPY